VRYPTLILLVALAVGCQQPTPSKYHLPTHEVTNGVHVVFHAVPLESTVTALLSAGAVKQDGMVWRFDIVDSPEKRQAITSALMDGAQLEGR